MNHNDHNENNLLSQCNAIEAAASIRALLNSILVTPSASLSSSSSSQSIEEQQPQTIDSVTTHKNNTSTTTTTGRITISTNHNNNYNYNNNSKNDYYYYYYQRLQSFTTLHYFAKPIHLSPIVCAVTGWELILLPTTTATTTTTRSSSMTSSSSNNQKTKSMNILSLPLRTTTTTSTDITTDTTTTTTETTLGISLIDTTSRLRCQCCHAILTIYIPNTLSTIGKNELILQYQQQLYLSHKISCLFRKPSEYFINTSLLDPVPTNCNTTTGSTPTSPQQYSLVVPTLLSRAIHQHPLSSLELVEQIHPWFIFQQKFNRLYPYIHQLDVTSNDFSFILPDHIQYYNYTNSENSSNNCGSDSIMTSPSPPHRQTLLALLVQYMLQKQPQTDAPLFDASTATATATASATTNIDDATVPIPKIITPREIQDAEITTALIILGWDLLDSATTGEETRTNHHHPNQRIASIQCIFCLSRHRLINNKTTALAPTHPDIDDVNNNNNNHGKTKRPRTSTNTNTISSPTSSQWKQPYMAHRYYCPWVCGFPLIQQQCQVNNTSNESDVIVKLDEMSAIPSNTPTFSLPLWQVVTNRLLLEAQKHQPWGENENHVNSNRRNTTNHTMIQNFLSVHQQFKSSISPLRCKNKRGEITGSSL